MSEWSIAARLAKRNDAGQLALDSTLRPAYQLGCEGIVSKRLGLTTLGEGQKPESARSEAGSRRGLGSLNARALGTRTATPETLTLAAQLAGFSRGDRRHRTRPFYCLGGHTLVVAGRA